MSNLSLFIFTLPQKKLFACCTSYILSIQHKILIFPNCNDNSQSIFDLANKDRRFCQRNLILRTIAHTRFFAIFSELLPFETSTKKTKVAPANLIIRIAKANASSFNVITANRWSSLCFSSNLFFLKINSKSFLTISLSPSISRDIPVLNLSSTG